MNIGLPPECCNNICKEAESAVALEVDIFLLDVYGHRF